MPRKYHYHAIVRTKELSWALRFESKKQRDDFCERDYVWMTVYEIESGKERHRDRVDATITPATLKQIRQAHLKVHDIQPDDLQTD